MVVISMMQKYGIETVASSCESNNKSPMPSGLFHDVAAKNDAFYCEHADEHTRDRLTSIPFRPLTGG